MFDPEDLYQSPNPLAEHYQQFDVAHRLLLSGHSHQAWPDVAFDGVQRAAQDAARHVDQKWEYAFERADRVREGYARLLDDSSGEYSLGEATHDLVVRLLSALPLRTRPRIVTTDGEYHSLRRQLDRLAEEGLEIVRVPAYPAETVAERLAAEVDERTSLVAVSSVYYLSAQIVPRLKKVAQACQEYDAELLVDAYHSLNVVPLSVRKEGLEDAFITGAGYKYCQLGEGNAFLRAPVGCSLRPVDTGWFAEFGTMTEAKEGHRVSYADGPLRFAGATYDPTSNYRAAEVFAFFARHELTPELLRAVSRHQIELLANLFDDLDLDPDVITRDRTIDLRRIGGFLALQSPRAGELQQLLLAAGVHTDARGEILRLGPAPYLADEQIEEAVGILDRVVRTL